MKKIGLILGVVLLAGIAMTSCSKEKDCKCTSKAGDFVGATVKHHIKKGDCSDLNKTIKEETPLGTIEAKYTCEEE